MPATNRAQGNEVLILGDDHGTELAGIFPNPSIARVGTGDIDDMLCLMTGIDQPPRQSRRQLRGEI